MKTRKKAKRTVPPKKINSAKGKPNRYLVKRVFTSLSLVDKALNLFERLSSFWRD